MIHPCDKPCGNKTASGYCATTDCINPHYSNIGTAWYGQSVQKRVATNADRIRAMSDYDLADFLTAIMDCCGNDLCGKFCPMWACCNNGPDNVEDWLKSPVEKEGE